jgi:CubicO group peptidase (beta-lactamase class C family)
MRIMRKLSIGLLAAAAFCQSLPLAKRPEDVGISSQRLDRIRRQMQADVDSKRIPGAVLLIARNGKIARLDALGFQERKSQAPMQRDSIFRIASMSKPITSVAAMILAEEGKLDIGAPVAQYLPEFKDVTVGVEKAAPKRAMTVQDLMRHTSGLTYGFFGNSPVDELYTVCPLRRLPRSASRVFGAFVSGLEGAQPCPQRPFYGLQDASRLNPPLEFLVP